MERIRVSASREYDVVIGGGLVSKLGGELFPLMQGKAAVIIADDITFSLFGDTVSRSVKDAGVSVEKFIIPHGEKSKSAENLVAILDFLAEKKLTRDDFIIALGGGVVGDLAGFAAATYLRGIAFVQVPTTLLAAVDSSVGGKTAINLAAGKNLAGAFYQPSLVLCDTDIIKRLPDEIFNDGMAEVIKYGAIRSERVLDLCALGARENIDEIISLCVTIKRDVVCKDEYDVGLRRLLNFGHTPAHAIEKLSNFAISHGRAVAAGMCIMARAGKKLGLCDGGIEKELSALCKKYALITETEFSAGEMAEVSLSDKKRGADGITLVVPERRGSCVLKTVADSEIVAYFSAGAEEEK